MGPNSRSGFRFHEAEAFGYFRPFRAIGSKKVAIGRIDHVLHSKPFRIKCRMDTVQHGLATYKLDLHEKIRCHDVVVMPAVSRSSVDRVLGIIGYHCTGSTCSTTDPMEPFLKRFARQLLERHGAEMDQVCIVLPGKRAGTFLRNYLAEAKGSTQWSPRLHDVGSFMSEVAGMRQGGSMELLFMLYDTHKALRGVQAEPLDAFLQWAPTALRDMSELDTHALDLDHVYRELKSYYDLEDWAESLGESPGQLRSGEHWRTTGQLHRTTLERMKERGIGTSGAVARQAMERVESGAAILPWKAVWFAGLNALEPATTRVIKSLQAQGKAHLAWDSDEHYLNDTEQEAGIYLRRSIAALGPGTIPAGSTIRGQERRVRHSIVPNAVAQASLAASLLAHLNPEDRAVTALVLADENLLMPLLTALPKEVGPINVTMGLPLEALPVHGCTEAFLELHANQRKFGLFRLQDIERLLVHPFLHQAGTSASAIAKLRALKRTKFSTDLLLKELENAGLELCPEAQAALQPLADVAKDLPLRMNAVLAWAQRYSAHDRYRTEQLFQIAKLQRRLDQGLLRIGAVVDDLDSYRTLRAKLMREERIAFIGEPLRGTQVMGVLETRALDNERIIVLGASEGTLPRTGQQQSWIPFSVRKTLKLPMRGDAEAIAAYHFQRLAHHAQHMELVHGTGEGPGCGEPSRFILQWQHELSGNSRTQFSSAIHTVPFLVRPSPIIAIQKDTQVLERFSEICQKGLSPSALAMWLRCPLDFYYTRALGIKEADTVDGRLGSDVLGEAVHHALEDVFKPFIGRPMQPGHLREAATSTHERLHAQLAGTFPGEVLARGHFRLRIEMAAKAMERHLNAEAVRCAKEETIVLALEHELEAVLRPGVRIKGRIDRVEMRNGVHHILDLKTGVVEQRLLNIAELDRSQFTAERAQALQLLIYGWMYLRSNPDVHLVRIGILPLQKASEAHGLMVHVAGSQDIAGRDMPKMEVALCSLIDGIMDKDTALTHDPDSKYCNACPAA